MLLDVRLRALVLALWIVSLQQFAHASTGITLHGRLLADEQEAADGIFVLATDDGERVTLTVSSEYVRLYLEASVGHRFSLALNPE